MIIALLTTIAVFGAISVALGKPLTANYLWGCSQPGLAIYNFSIHEYEMAIMFSIYSLIAVYGIWYLRRLDTCTH
jgi:hypothetical protein